ncbi:MAG: RidA family protein [Geminicoccaceae bacterium]
MVVQNVIELSCWERLAEATAGIGEARLFPPEPPLDAQGRMPDGFGAQFRASLERLEARLRAAGGSLDHVLRAEIRVVRSGPEAYGALQAAFLEGFAAMPRPARCVSAATGLAHGGLVEVGAVAATGAPPGSGPDAAIIAADGPAPCAPSPHARAHEGGVWVTAQVGSDPASGSLAPVPGGSAVQLAQAMSNLEAILRASGSSLERVVHLRLQYTAASERDLLARLIKERPLPFCAVELAEVPFIPTAQAGVTVKVDAVARLG